VATETNPELEARIHANPDDRDAYQVYGDWLSERGDPRGELISVQIKLSQLANGDDAELKKREQAIITANKSAWLGELAKLEDKDFHVEWRWGFVDSARIGPPTDDYETSEIDFPDTIGAVLAMPRVEFLREIVIGAISYDDYPTSWSDCVEALAENEIPASLQRLEFTRGGYWDISSTELGSIASLYPKLQNLRELSIEMGQMDFGEMNLPALRKLEIVTGGLSNDNVSSIVKARWPNLETLSLCIGETGNDYGCNVQFSDLEPILVAETMPSLKHLGLANSSLADEIAAALPGSRILPRLETLDLSKGTMTDAGANAILDNWQSFAHLKELDLSHGYFSAEVLEKLRAAKGPKIVLENLERADDDYRYCQISE
jgi:uncharacterized protein (TIGR02996 family)